MKRSFIRCFRATLRVYIDPGIYLLAPFLLLTLPLNVLLSWLIAAIIHEAGHILVLILLGGKIGSIRIGVGGAIIDGEDLGNRKNILCILAGPAFGVLPLLLIHHFPETALFALVLTVYNLLPFYPLDGGRILRILRDLSENINAAALVIEYLTLITLISAAVYFRTPIPLFPLILPLREKYLANRRKRGYNSATIKVR